MIFLKRLFGLTPKEESASLAKERLKILISHERTQSQAPDFLPELKREIIEVISKYVRIDPEQIQIAMDCIGDTSSLELNFTIPDAAVIPEPVPVKKMERTRKPKVTETESTTA